MAHTNNWDETTPTNATNAVDIDDHIRKVRLDVRERLAIDHNFASSDDGSDAYGIHDKVTFKDKIASPGLASNQKVLYPKTDDYECELRYKDKRGIDSYLSFIGEVRMRLGTTVPTGWLALNGSSIGQTGSGADLTGSDYEDLYKYLWGTLDDTAFPVAGGRGGSADADWAALKKGTMPDARSRMPICAGQGSGLTLRTIGYVGGTETKDVTHYHGPNTIKFYLATWVNPDFGASATNACPTLKGSQISNSYGPNAPGTSFYYYTNTAASVGQTSTDGSATQDVMNPWIALTMIIRY